MKPEHDAWRALEEHAASQLRGNFADLVMRKSQGPTPVAWQRLQERGAAQIRPGFADRVLRAVRERFERPSIFGQLALSAATAACCVAAVLYYHDRNVREQEEVNLASWEQLVTESQYFGMRQ